MLRKALSAVLLVAVLVHGQEPGTCKEPIVEERLLADDVRFASPFYVIGLPRNTRTEQMDNVCYTYFENGGVFFHVMSITFKNGTNTFYKFSKGDISNRLGLAEATGLSGSECMYHDYTLTPICNVSVFILYRCFIQGKCLDIDIGITSGVDARVVLAANPKISPECRQETESSLKDTSMLDGGDYVILPQKLSPQCITKYNNIDSIGNKRAIGSKEVSDSDLSVRFGGEMLGLPTAPTKKPPQATITPQSAQASWPSQNGFGSRPAVAQNTPQMMTTFNQYGTSGGSAWASTYSQSAARPGYTAAPAWTKNNGQWNAGPTPWNGPTIQPGAETHYHMWQTPTGTIKTSTGKNPNVYYHIHSWENPPPGCCKCN